MHSNGKARMPGPSLHVRVTLLQLLYRRPVLTLLIPLLHGGLFGALGYFSECSDPTHVCAVAFQRAEFRLSELECASTAVWLTLLAFVAASYTQARRSILVASSVHSNVRCLSLSMSAAAPASSDGNRMQALASIATLLLLYCGRLAEKMGERSRRKDRKGSTVHAQHNAGVTDAAKAGALLPSQAVHVLAAAHSPGAAEAILWRWAVGGASEDSQYVRRAEKMVHSLQRELEELVACSGPSPLAGALSAMTHVYVLLFSLGLLFSAQTNMDSSGEYERAALSSKSFASLLLVPIIALLAAAFLETARVLQEVPGLSRELAEEWVAELAEEHRVLFTRDVQRQHRALQSAAGFSPLEPRKEHASLAVSLTGGVSPSGSSQTGPVGKSIQNLQVSSPGTTVEEKSKEVSSKGVPAQPALAEADALASLARQDPLPAEGRVSAVAIDQEAKDSAVQENTRAVMMLMRKIDGFLDLRAAEPPVASALQRSQHQYDRLPALGYSSYEPLLIDAGIITSQSGHHPAHQHSSPPKKQRLPGQVVSSATTAEVEKGPGGIGGDEKTMTVRAKSSFKPLAYEASRVRLTVDDLAAHMMGR